MLTTISNQMDFLLKSLQTNIPYVLMILAGLMIINILNSMLSYRLNVLGIYPRTFRGLIGIIFSPFLHGSFSHVFFNAIPLFVLINIVLLAGWHHFMLLSVALILLSGLLTWLIGRRAFHVGASGMIMAYWSYLLINTIRHPGVITVLLVLICIYYFGNSLFSFIPTKRATSWEGHIAGFVAGIIVAYAPVILRHFN